MAIRKGASLLLRASIKSGLSRRALSAPAYGRLPQGSSDWEYEDFYRYTSGRWLWNEEEQLRERYKRFNVPGLKQIAAEAVDAQSCLSITKLAEGGFNKVFRLLMDNDAVVIARIPNPNVGPISKVMASEVATMDFVQNVIGIPVPKVLAWDGTISNSAESEYMLMEEAKGTQLEEVWEDMKLRDKLKVVEDIVAIQKKLQSVTFSRYGNIYYRSDALQGYSKVEVFGDLPQSAKTYAEDRFAIGPIAEKAFWEGEENSTFADRGPWPDAQAYLRAISQRERSRMPQLESMSAKRPLEDEFDELDAAPARLALLDKFDAVSPYLPPSDPTLNRATLSHWDLRTLNIFVKGGRITSLIDWQDTWVGPLFMQERRPQFIEYQGKPMLRLPEDFSKMEDKDEKARIRNKVERSILYKFYGEEIQKQNSVLQEVFDLPLARKRRETVSFASETWEGSTIPLRECLYQLQRQWDKLETGVPCPIAVTTEEIEALDRISADWNDNADFWDNLSGFVSRDGYTSNEDYDEARRMFADLREAGLQQFSGKELEDFEEGSRWAERPKKASTTSL